MRAPATRCTGTSPSAWRAISLSSYFRHKHASSATSIRSRLDRGGAMNQKKVTRREALGALGMAGAALSLACSGETPTSPTSTTTTTTTGTASGVCAVTPSETIGPYPSLTDMIRSDVREDRAGAPLALTIV